MLSYHKESYTLAFIQLFPDLHLDISQFDQIPSILLSLPLSSLPLSFFLTYFILDQYWQHECNRRFFFENFARARGFDPLVPSRWYFTPRRSIYSTKVSPFPFFLSFFLSFFLFKVSPYPRALPHPHPSCSVSLLIAPHRSSSPLFTPHHHYPLTPLPSLPSLPPSLPPSPPISINNFNLLFAGWKFSSGILQQECGPSPHCPLPNNETGPFQI